MSYHLLKVYGGSLTDPPKSAVERIKGVGFHHVICFTTQSLAATYLPCPIYGKKHVYGSGEIGVWSACISKILETLVKCRFHLDNPFLYIQYTLQHSAGEAAGIERYYIIPSRLSIRLWSASVLSSVELGMSSPVLK